MLLIANSVVLFCSVRVVVYICLFVCACLFVDCLLVVVVVACTCGLVRGWLFCCCFFMRFVNVLSLLLLAWMLFICLVNGVDVFVCR